jgi:AcrR family transcriptional regulator
MAEKLDSIKASPALKSSSGKNDNYMKKKQQILQVAAELILKKGFSSTSMNDIAAQLGFNKAALYYYCQNKEEIALEIERINLEYVKAIFREISEKCDSGLDKLRHFYIGYAKMMATPFGAAGVQIVAQPISDEFAQRSKLLFKETDDTIRGYINQGQMDGSLAKLDIRWCDFVLFGTLHWMPHWYLQQGNMDPETLGEEMFNVMLKGFLPR